MVLFPLPLLHPAHCAEPVAAPDFLYVGSGEAAAQEFAGYVAQLRCRRAANNLAVTVEIGSNAYMFNAGNVYRVLQMGKEIVERCLALLAQEAAVHCNLHHAAFCSQRTHLLVGEVARMVTECTAR